MGGIPLLRFLGIYVLARIEMIAEVEGFNFPSQVSAHVFGPTRSRGTNMLQATSDPMDSSSHLESSAEGDDFMAQLMGEVNQREGLRRKEGVRTLKRPSALLPPHAVLEHVLVSLRMPDFPTDGYGLTQAFLFSALDQEVSRGPVDYRRDWTDSDELSPRFVQKESKRLNNIQELFRRARHLDDEA